MKKLKVLCLLALVGFAGIASAAPRLDLVPESLSFARGLDDDVSMTYSQHVALMVKNVGDTTWTFRGSPVVVLVGGAPFIANVYGPRDSYWQLHAPIRPGQQGMVQFKLRLNTIRHCQRLPIQIDADRTNQYGLNVFTNDIKTLTAVDRSAIRLCPIDVVRGRDID